MALIMSKVRRTIISTAIASSLFVSASFFLFAQSRIPSTIADKSNAARLADNSPSAHPYISSSESAKLLSEHFSDVRRVEAFPDACKKAFAALTHEPAFSLANPGQSFQSTDVILPGPSLPWRRLIIGAKTSDRCVIFYEKGGFVTTYQAVVIDISQPDTPAFIWGGRGGGSPQDISGLITRITGGAFEQGGPNDW